MERIEKLYDEININFEFNQNKQEFCELMKYIREGGYGNFMEIGSRKGATFLGISTLLPASAIKISLDLANGGFGGINEFEFNQKNKKLKSLIPNSHYINQDSHSKEAKAIVNYILNEEKLDILFIDGDHTYEGVKQDYETYKDFVSDDGIIIFHDIKDIKKHRDQNCYVSKLWKELKGNKKEILGVDDCYGIGIFKKEPKKYRIYQIYFDEESRRGLNSIFTPIYNTTNTKYFENDVILQLYDKLPQIKEKYVGTTSWKFRSKTAFFDLSEFEDKILKAIQEDNGVILYPPYHQLTSTPFGTCNCIERNKQYFSPLYQLSNLIDKKKILPFNMEIDKWTISYCNFWIAKKHIFKHYVENVLKPVIFAFENDNDIIELVKRSPFKHADKDYPLYPFLLELLMGFYVNHFHIKHTSIMPVAAKIDKNKRILQQLNNSLQILHNIKQKKINTIFYFDAGRCNCMTVTFVNSLLKSKGYKCNPNNKKFYKIDKISKIMTGVDKPEKDGKIYSEWKSVSDKLDFEDML